jgi:RNA binding exosome subunit
MIDIDGLIQDFEYAQTNAFEEIQNEVPGLGDYDIRREIERAMEEVSNLLYQKLEQLAEANLETALDDLSEVLSGSVEFFLRDFDGDNLYLDHMSTGLSLRLSVEEN